MAPLPLPDRALEVLVSVDLLFGAPDILVDLPALPLQLVDVLTELHDLASHFIELGLLGVDGLTGGLELLEHLGAVNVALRGEFLFFDLEFGFDIVFSPLQLFEIAVDAPAVILS